MSVETVSVALESVVFFADSTNNYKHVRNRLSRNVVLALLFAAYFVAVFLVGIR